MKFCETCHSSYPSDFTTCPKDQSTLRSITELMPGLILRDKYEILERLGAGGMGTVYKARHTAFGEMRAIKVIDSHLIHDDESLARFRGEAVLARKLLHPNVVRVEDLDSTEDGRPFIVMEYVIGRSLRDVLRQEPGLAPARAVDFVAQACSALAAAHALGILHRDMKPENLMLVPQPDGGELVKVLDFGLAKVLEGFQGAGQGVSTQTGMVVGTPEYISPEQAVPAQGLAHLVRAREAGLAVLREGFHHQRRECLWNAALRMPLVRGLGQRLEMVEHHAHRRVRHERQVAREELVEHDPQRVEVGPPVELEARRGHRLLG